jgi:hypothetical protein
LSSDEEQLRSEYLQLLERDFKPYSPSPFRVTNAHQDPIEAVNLHPRVALQQLSRDLDVGGELPDALDTTRYISAWKRSFARGRAKTWFHKCNTIRFVTKDGSTHDRPDLDWLKGRVRTDNGNITIQADSVGLPPYKYEVHEGSEYTVSLATDFLMVPETGEYDVAALVPIDSPSKPTYKAKIGYSQYGNCDVEWGAAFTLTIIQYHRVAGDLEPLHYYPRIVESAPPHLAPIYKHSAYNWLAVEAAGSQTDAFSANSARVYLEKSYAGSNALFAIISINCRYAQHIDGLYAEPGSYIGYRTIIKNPFVGMTLIG